MRFIDAYEIVEDYVDALANGKNKGEPYKRKSKLKNNRNEICVAFKLFLRMYCSGIPYQMMILNFTR